MQEGVGGKIIWLCCLTVLGLILSGCGNLPLKDSTTDLTATAVHPPGGTAVNIVGTRPPTPRVEGGSPAPRCVLNSTVCRLPCWEGIVPGETSLADALTHLNGSHLVDPNSIKSLTGEPQVQVLQWQTRWSDNSADYLQAIGWPNTILARNGVVESVELWMDSTACTLTAEDVVDEYGPPQKTVYDPFAGGGEIAWYQLDLMYPATGLVYGTMAQDPPHRRSWVGVVYCFEPQSLDQLVDQPARYPFQRQLYNEPGIDLEDWTTRLEDWKGFAGNTPAP